MDALGDGCNVEEGECQFRGQVTRYRVDLELEPVVFEIAFAEFNRHYFELVGIGIDKPPDHHHRLLLAPCSSFFYPELLSSAKVLLIKPRLS